MLERVLEEDDGAQLGLTRRETAVFVCLSNRVPGPSLRAVSGKAASSCPSARRQGHPSSDILRLSVGLGASRARPVPLGAWGSVRCL